MQDYNDAILPDDFVDTPTADNTEVATESEDFLSDETTDYTNEVVETEETSTQSQPTLKVKYNHEEKELSYEEAVALAQKGMNYEKAVERAAQEAEQRALDNYIAQQGYEWNGKRIETYAEYQDALKEQELIERYQDVNLPQDVIEKLLKVDKLEERFNEQEKMEYQKNQEELQFSEFVDLFPNVEPSSIPQQVWDKFESGVPLKYAYMEYENSLLRTKTNVVQNNVTNKQKAPNLGVTAFGSGEPEKSTDPFLEGFLGR